MFLSMTNVLACPTCVNFVHATNAANHYATPPTYGGDIINATNVFKHDKRPRLSGVAVPGRQVAHVDGQQRSCERGASDGGGVC